ncbi:MAG: DJ-1/PfpI family protein [Gammaproteobacteria bacterium]|nr:DJ-1/PfpI family protein [Gammaproteobacteria bacterium]
MPKVLVPLANGFEETEAVTIIDILRRAEVTVTVASLNGEPVTGNHHITITPDIDLDSALAGDFDLVALPGGMPGADNLEKDPRIEELLVKMAATGKFVAAICAAPKVLKAAGLLDDREATSFPGFIDKDPAKGMRYSTEAVVQDGKVVTSRGPGTAMDFALKLAEILVGKEKRDEVEARLQRP